MHFASGGSDFGRPTPQPVRISAETCRCRSLMKLKDLLALDDRLVVVWLGHFAKRIDANIPVRALIESNAEAVKALQIAALAAETNAAKHALLMALDQKTEMQVLDNLRRRHPEIAALAEAGRPVLREAMLAHLPLPGGQTPPRRPSPRRA